MVLMNCCEGQNSNCCNIQWQQQHDICKDCHIFCFLTSSVILLYNLPISFFFEVLSYQLHCRHLETSFMVMICASFSQGKSYHFFTWLDHILPFSLELTYPNQTFCFYCIIIIVFFLLPYFLILSPYTHVPVRRYFVFKFFFLFQIKDVLFKALCHYFIIKG